LCEGAEPVDLGPLDQPFALGQEVAHVWLPLVFIERRSVPVQLVEDPERWLLVDGVGDIEQRSRLCSAMAATVPATNSSNSRSCPARIVNRTTRPKPSLLLACAAVLMADRIADQP
jgi:hypothetical protein